MLVTGASRGLGRAIAVAPAARGHHVAVHCGGDRDGAAAALAAIEAVGAAALSPRATGL